MENCRASDAVAADADAAADRSDTKEVSPPAPYLDSERGDTKQVSAPASYLDTDNTARGAVLPDLQQGMFTCS
jgi:hypothetical protein